MRDSTKVAGRFNSRVQWTSTSVLLPWFSLRHLRHVPPSAPGQTCENTGRVNRKASLPKFPELFCKPTVCQALSWVAAISSGTWWPRLQCQDGNTPAGQQIVKKPHTGHTPETAAPIIIYSPLLLCLLLPPSLPLCPPTSENLFPGNTQAAAQRPPSPSCGLLNVLSKICN